MGAIVRFLVRARRDAVNAAEHRTSWRRWSPIALLRVGASGIVRNAEGASIHGVWVMILILRWTGTLVAFGVAAVLPFALSSTAATSTIASDSSSGLAYQGNGQIYLINPDGTSQEPIVFGVADASFSFSPDGTRIVFTSGKSRNDFTRLRIATVPAPEGAATEGKLLTPRNLDSIYPAWAPDGKTIFFTSGYADDQGFSISLIQSNGTGLKKLTTGTWFDFDPAVSPDGKWVIFSRTPIVPEDADFPFRWSLMEMRPDGSDLHLLAKIAAGNQCICADWSPDGTKIAYESTPDPVRINNAQIFIMNANGTGRTQLTRGPDNEDPDWSPDGSKIAFWSTRNGNGEIYVMNADGTQQTRVTHDPWYSALPRWRPG